MHLPGRSHIPEIMDGDDFSRAELERNLSDLARYHRCTGGLRRLLRALRAMTQGFRPGAGIAILDVGAGGGDVARGVASWARRQGWVPTVVAVDLSRRILEAGRSRDGSGGEPRWCLADARVLPCRDRAFDVAYSSLVLHHLDGISIEAVLAEMGRVTRLGFVVSDLRRSALALASVWALTRLTTRNRLTLNDGPLSVRRALTMGEMRDLAARAGVRVVRDGPARMLLTFRHAGDGGPP